MDDLTREIYVNIDTLSRNVFYVLVAVSLTCFSYGVWRKARRWRLRREPGGPRDWRKTAQRLFEKVLIQRSVRQGKRTLAGWAHAALFAGFTILFIGTILVGFEHWGATFLGLPEGEPLFHQGAYFALFEMALDIAGLFLIGGLLFFIWRAGRGSTSMENRASDWVIVLTLLFLGITGYVVEGARILLDQTPMPWLSPVGLVCAYLLESIGFSEESVSDFHRAAWWIHALGALGLIAAIPYSRLLHIVSGTLNIALSDYELGSMVPVSIEKIEETGTIGLGRPQELTGAQLLALDACVSCGRCQDECPAFAAGKPLSPRNLVQDIRQEIDRLSFNELQDTESTTSESLHNNVISAETLWACTTCGACVQSCPVEVAPMEFITDMRRYLIAEGQLRGAPATSLQNLQRSGNPWGLAPVDRYDWAEGLSAPTVNENPNFEILYWVGCAASYDPRVTKVARAVVQLLNTAKVNFACLGPEEVCTGESARRMGDEFLFQELAEKNITSLDRHKVKKIVTHCPHCLNSLTRDYAQFGGDYEVQHHSQLLTHLVQTGKLKIPGSADGVVTYHDPCYLARINNVIEPPRALIQDFLAPDRGQLVEMERNGCKTGCCGAGGGRMWFDDKPDGRIGTDRIKEALNTGAGTIAVSCPFCLTMMSDGVAARKPEVAVKDIAELMAEALE